MNKCYIDWSVQCTVCVLHEPFIAHAQGRKGMEEVNF